MQKRVCKMTQSERRIFLINKLLREQPQYKEISVPKAETEQKRLLRALMNIRRPMPIGGDFLAVQDEYLKAEIKIKGITDLSSLNPISGDIYLWQGDITTLRCGAIVNAANSEMLGCFCPCHGCIDNAIHTFSGIQLRLECADIMQKQGCSEPVGKAKLTKAYNLPCKYILHTVGPFISGDVTRDDEEQLASCYRSCLALAEEKGIKSIAFCCISTGEFHFPNRKAAEIAVRTAKAFKENNHSRIKVIFNVFKDTDYEIYRELLG